MVYTSRHTHRDRGRAETREKSTKPSTCFCSCSFSSREKKRVMESSEHAITSSSLPAVDTLNRRLRVGWAVREESVDWNQMVSFTAPTNPGTVAME
jgi:hypothetical protein